MTRSQELELKRMTEVMWFILYRAEGSEGVEPTNSDSVDTSPRRGSWNDVAS